MCNTSNHCNFCNHTTQPVMGNRNSEKYCGLCRRRIDQLESPRNTPTQKLWRSARVGKPSNPPNGWISQSHLASIQAKATAARKAILRRSADLNEIESILA